MLYLICSVITFISACVSFGFSIAAYNKSKRTTGDALTNAMYAVSPSLSLLIVSFIPLFFSYKNF